VVRVVDDVEMVRAFDHWIGFASWSRRAEVLYCYVVVGNYAR